MHRSRPAQSPEKTCFKALTVYLPSVLLYVHAEYGVHVVTYPTQHQGHKTQLIHYAFPIPTDPTSITNPRILCCSRFLILGILKQVCALQSLLSLRHAQGLIYVLPGSASHFQSEPSIYRHSVAMGFHVAHKMHQYTIIPRVLYVRRWGFRISLAFGKSGRITYN